MDCRLRAWHAGAKTSELIVHEPFDIPAAAHHVENDRLITFDR